MEVGIQTGNSFIRKEVPDLSQIVKRYNGIANIFYNPYKGREKVDYFIMDLDGPTAFQDNEKLCDYFRDFEHVHVFSGKKGFHFYLKIKPLKNDEMLRAYFMGFINYLRDELDLKSWDYQTTLRLATGSGLIRVPGTLHIGARYCTYIPCHVTFNDILKMTTQPQPLFRHDGKEYDITVHVGYTYQYKPQDIKLYDVGDVDLQIVGELVRPCIFAQSFDSPNHFIRTNLVTELAWIGYDEDTIMRIVEKFRWKNFNPEISRYHVRKILEKVKQGKLFPASCRTLKEQGIGCKTCNYYNWWYYHNWC